MIMKVSRQKKVERRPNLSSIIFFYIGICCYLFLTCIRRSLNIKRIVREHRSKGTHHMQGAIDAVHA